MYTGLYDVVYAREETTPWLRLCFLQANTKIYVMGMNLCTRIWVIVMIVDSPILLQGLSKHTSGKSLSPSEA